jgi:hypothetical protein
METKADRIEAQSRRRNANKAAAERTASNELDEKWEAMDEEQASKKKTTPTTPMTCG